MQETSVKEVMTRDPVIVSPEDTLREVSRRMKDVGCGVLPVGTKEKIEGIITDRDIVIRALAAGGDPSVEKAADHMTRLVCTCSERDSLAKAVETMRDNKVSRLVVVNNDGKMTGILTFGAILRKNEDEQELSEIVHCAVGQGNGQAATA